MNEDCCEDLWNENAELFSYTRSREKVERDWTAIKAEREEGAETRKTVRSRRGGGGVGSRWKEKDRFVRWRNVRFENRLDRDAWRRSWKRIVYLYEEIKGSRRPKQQKRGGVYVSISRVVLSELLRMYRNEKVRMDEKISRYYIIYLFIRHFNIRFSRIVKLLNNSCLLRSDIVCSHWKHDRFFLIVYSCWFLSNTFAISIIQFNKSEKKRKNIFTLLFLLCYNYIWIRVYVSRIF